MYDLMEKGTVVHLGTVLSRIDVTLNFAKHKKDAFIILIVIYDKTNVEMCYTLRFFDGAFPVSQS